MVIRTLTTLLISMLIGPLVAWAQPEELIRVALRTDRPIVQAGKEVWVEFTVTNLTDQPVTLRVPNAANLKPDASPVGLPLAHVFSGIDFSALAILDEHKELYKQTVTQPPRQGVPEVHLAPNATIGTRVELGHYYEILKRPGTYTLIWRPYQGQVVSAPLELRVLPERQAVILTEYGKMTLRFYYDKAPNHIANFIELIDDRFYDRLAFNRVVPGGVIQGGDPRGDRRGIRPDGKRLKAEFNDIPFELGTVGMARSPRDPDSASCQFFICLGRQVSFDGQQTAFAHLIGDESFETLRRIAAVPTDSNDRPLKPVYIRTISLENVPSEEWERAGQAPETGRPATRPAATQPALSAGE